MVHRSQRLVRAGAVTVESAFAYSIMFMLLIGLLVGGMGVFRFQEVAALAREGARYASVHGKQYQQETGKAAATEDDIFKTVIYPKAVGLDRSRLKSTVTWKSSNRPLTVTTDVARPVGNTVTVRVTYQWLPELLFGSTIQLSSSSTAQICY